LGFFDNPTQCILGKSSAIAKALNMDPDVKLYGTGNAGSFLAVAPGLQAILPDPASIAIATAAPKPLVIEGVGFDYADMPVTTGLLSTVHS
jgi:hypothetical protein